MKKSVDKYLYLIGRFVFTLGVFLQLNLLYAQENIPKPEVDINVNDSSGGMGSWWMWAVGIAVFIIVIVAITNRGRRRD